MWSQFKDESSDYGTGAEGLVPSMMCSTSILGLFMDVWRLWVPWWLNSLQQGLYSTSTGWAGLPHACIGQLTVCTKCKCHFSVSPAPEYLILDPGNHLTASKPSCKIVCFWRKMWYLMYKMEKPTLYRAPKPSVPRWILEVFWPCIMNPYLNIQLILCSSL